MDLKKLTEVIGKILVVVSFVFLVYVISSLDFTPLKTLFSFSWVPLIMILALIFSWLYFPMAFAWRRLLMLSAQKILDRDVMAVYLRTVIYKYAPGNVFHFLGRHSLKDSHKLSHKTIAFANGVEILWQLFAVSFIIMIGALFFDISLNIGEYVELSQTKILLAFSLLMVVTFVVLMKKKYRDILFEKGALVSLVVVFFCHLLFLLGSAMLLVGVYVLFLDVDFTFIMFVQTIFISSIAWLLGFVVPGAPGGIGIREAILVMFLPAILLVSKELVIAGALIYRVVTMFGESLTYFWAKLLKIKKGHRDAVK